MAELEDKAINFMGPPVVGPGGEILGISGDESIIHDYGRIISA